MISGQALLHVLAEVKSDFMRVHPLHTYSLPGSERDFKPEAPLSSL